MSEVKYLVCDQCTKKKATYFSSDRIGWYRLADPELDFCSLDCLIAWAEKRKAADEAI